MHYVVIGLPYLPYISPTSPRISATSQMHYVVIDLKTEHVGHSIRPYLYWGRHAGIRAGKQTGMRAGTAGRAGGLVGTCMRGMAWRGVAWRVVAWRVVACRGVARRTPRRSWSGTSQTTSRNPVSYGPM